MRYLPGSILSFLQSSLLFLIGLILVASFSLPSSALGFETFSDESDSNWDTIIDDTESPADTGFEDKAYNSTPSRLLDRRVEPSPRQESPIQAYINQIVNTNSTAKDSSKKVTYSGIAEADGRPATLVLTFQGNTVSGRLQAKGTSKPNIRIPSTDISFVPVPLNGAWESDTTTISASWKGGDYMNGTLLTDQPTEGNLTIKVVERNGKKVVFLHRISTSQYGYAFPLKGLVYTPADSDGEDAPAASGNGYWDPVGTWSGVLELKLSDDVKQIDFQAAFEKTGNVTVTASARQKKSEQLEGTWKREGNGVRIQWSKATIQKGGFDETSIYAFFEGENCLTIREDNDFIKLYRDARKESKAGKSKKLPVDPSKIVGIELSRASLKVVPDTKYPLPSIYGVLRGSKKLIELPNIKGNWTGFQHVNVNDNPGNGVIEVGPLAKPGTSGDIRVDVTIGGRPYLAKCEINVVEEIKVGVFECAVWLKYEGEFSQELPKKPLSAIIALNGPGGKQVVQVKEAGDCKFDNLEKGNYRLNIQSVELPPIPDKYVSSSMAHLNIKARDIPSVFASGRERWDAKAALYWPMLLKDKQAETEEKSYDYCIYGVVSYQGKPIDKIKVTLVNQDGSSIRDAETDEFGQYSINTQDMARGKYWIQALKMVNKADPLMATDGDFMHPGSRPEKYPQQTIQLPVSNFGEEINIECLTRKEIFSD